MSTASRIVKHRNLKRSTEHHTLLKISLCLVVLLSLAGAVGALAGYWFYVPLTRDLPSPYVLPGLLEPPDGNLLQPTRLYDRSGEHVILTLQDPAASGSRYLLVKQAVETGSDAFVKNLIDATVAASDPGFWTHNGFSLEGMSNGSHPTLAQRLVSDLVLSAESPSLQRNFRERLLAAQITSLFGREKIMEWYLNSARYGDQVYGADAAAFVYFGKSATTLNLAESTLLAAMSEQPVLSAYTDLPALRARQEKLIQTMVINRMISYKQADLALKEKIVLQNPSKVEPLAANFTQLVLSQLGSQMPLDRLYRGGLEIITSLDYDLQVQVECAAQIQVARLAGLTEASVETGSSCEAAQLLPTIQLDQATLPQVLSAEVVIIDPHTGQVLALVGGSDQATQLEPLGMHPGGTIFTPFLYLTAFTRGLSPSTLEWDLPAAGDMAVFTSNPESSKSLGMDEFHGPVRLREAFVNDYTSVGRTVLQQIGQDNLYYTEQQFGINPPDQVEHLTAGLDGFLAQPITLLEAMHAYSAFANGGIITGQSGVSQPASGDANSLSASSVLRVTGTDGTVWLDWSTPMSRIIINPQLSYLVTDVLSDEVIRWPGLGHPNALEIGRPVAAKVGKVDEGSGAWTIGYTPQVAVGVWMGGSKASDTAVPVTFPAGLWHAVMQYASRELPVESFSVPAGISQLRVCNPSGLLVTELCPDVVDEVFLKGSEPTQADNLYQEYVINRETGLLATVFTPSEMLEEKVYLDLPPEAVSWATATGVPVPPDTYDIIPAIESTNPDVQLADPLMFDHVSGQVSISGTAAGDDFAYYRIQVGKGLYPPAWIQLGKDVTQPVKNGTLGMWDTEELQGLFVIQLLVVRNNLEVDRSIVQVTIDNTPPRVEILSPHPGEEFSYQPGMTTMLQVAASDNIELDRVEFYVDGRLVSTLQQPPWIILWDPRMGGHLLVVQAYDRAGNTDKAESVFTIHP